MDLQQALSLGTLSKEELVDLLIRSQKALESESAVLDLASPKVVLVGDTHGDLETTQKVLARFLPEGWLVLMLGDYVDRGPYQLENINFLLRCKVERRDQLFMLRGNHETPTPNMYYGFYDVVTKKLDREAYNLYAQLFSELPYAAVVDRRFLALHGGLPSKTCNIDQLRDRLAKRELDPSGDAFELLWNDPSESLRGFAPSSRGPGVYLFGRDVALGFLQRSKLEAIARSHEPVQSGHRFIWDRKVLTVFSCRFYGIRPAIALIEAGSLSVQAADQL